MDDIDNTDDITLAASATVAAATVSIANTLPTTDKTTKDQLLKGILKENARENIQTEITEIIEIPEMLPEITEIPETIEIPEKTETDPEPFGITVPEMVQVYTSAEYSSNITTLGKLMTEDLPSQTNDNEISLKPKDISEDVLEENSTSESSDQRTNLDIETPENVAGSDILSNEEKKLGIALGLDENLNADNLPQPNIITKESDISDLDPDLTTNLHPPLKSSFSSESSDDTKEDAKEEGLQQPPTQEIFPSTSRTISVYRSELLKKSLGPELAKKKSTWKKMKRLFDLGLAYRTKPNIDESKRRARGSKHSVSGRKSSTSTARGKSSESLRVKRTDPSPSDPSDPSESAGKSVFSGTRFKLGLMVPKEKNETTDDDKSRKWAGTYEKNLYTALQHEMKDEKLKKKKVRDQ